MSRLPSPCLDVCKYKLRGHCIACAMTKMEKARFDALGPDGQAAFVRDLIDRQKTIGSARTWPQEYARKCERAGVAPPYDLV